MHKRSAARGNRLADRTLAAVAGIAIGLASLALADDRTWTNPAGGTFATAGNWAGGLVPGPADAAMFNLGSASPYTVTLDSVVFNQQLRVANDTVDLNLNGQTYALSSTSASNESLRVGETTGQTARLTVTGGGTLAVANGVVGAGTGAIGVATISAGSRWQSSGSFTVGDNGAGTITVHGEMTGIQGRIGRRVGGSGTLIVDGASAVLNVPSSGMLIGSQGTGRIHVRNGATVNDAGSFIAAFGGSGSAFIDGPTSRWNTVDGLYVGYNGPGMLTITTGGTLRQTGTGFATAVGVLAGSTGTVQLADAGQVDLAAQFSVGVDGTGSVFVATGSDVVARRVTADTHAFIGEGATGAGFVSVSGIGSTFSGDGALAVGYIGQGTLSVSLGGVVNSASGHVGRFAGSSGTVLLTGAGSAWNATSGIFVGGDGTASGGSGLLQFGSLASVNAGAILRTHPLGRVNWNTGGQFSANVVQLSGGTFSMQAGADKVLRTGSLSISGSGNLDLADNAAIVDYSGLSPLVFVRNFIVNGRNAGAWNGPGIRSSVAAAAGGDLAIGYAESADLFTAFPATFRGQSVDATAILMRLTKVGDADLSGTVDIDDFGRLASNFNNTALWSQGDFNFDGETNIDDFGLLAGNFNEAYPAAGVSPRGVAIPEPISSGLWAMIGTAIAAVGLRSRGHASVG